MGDKLDQRKVSAALFLGLGFPSYSQDLWIQNCIFQMWAQGELVQGSKGTSAERKLQASSTGLPASSDLRTKCNQPGQENCRREPPAMLGSLRKCSHALLSSAVCVRPAQGVQSWLLKHTTLVRTFLYFPLLPFLAQPWSSQSVNC